MSVITLNHWKMQAIWDSFQQNIGIEDLQNELLYYIEQDQEEEFWFVVEDQNEPIVIGWSDFIYGMHLQGIPTEYRERFLIWILNYVKQNPLSKIGDYYRAGLWNADILQILSTKTTNHLHYFVQQALDILRTEVECPCRTSKKTKNPILPHKSFSRLYVRKYTITEFEFEIERNQSDQPLELKPPISLLPKTDILPLTVVQFCNFLSEKRGFKPFYKIQNEMISTVSSSNGYRIPTVDEWEHLAKCDTKFDYSGGQIVDHVAWYRDNSRGMKQIVGQRKPNKWNLFDMSGNVNELVHKNVVRNRIQRIHYSDLQYRLTEHFGLFGGSYRDNVDQVSLWESCHRQKRNTVAQRYFGVRLLRYA